MFRSSSVAGILVVAALGVGVPGSAGSAGSEALIRPGIGIGKVRLGMSLAQVRHALGRPQLLNRKQDRGLGRRYLEYLWDYWRVGLLGSRGHERVVRVATTARRQRTREGVGPGSSTRDLARHYRRSAICVERSYNVPDAGVWIVLRGPGTRMTAFWLVKANGSGYKPRVRPIVGEVMVQQSWITPIAGHCGSDWPTWRW